MIACVNIGNNGIVEPSISNIVSLFQFVSRCDDPTVVDRLSPARRRDDATNIRCHPADRYPYILIHNTNSIDKIVHLSIFRKFFFITEVLLLYILL